MARNDSSFRENSEAVQAHLQICQSVIQRMAANSAGCKSWCITLVSAILVLVADKSKPQYAYIALIPTILFLALDTYYLSLERRFRDSYNAFIQKLHDREVDASDLYAVVPLAQPVKSFFACLLSFSIWPLYLTLSAMIWLAKVLVM